jgi:pantoate--beta-alanine ligase
LMFGPGGGQAGATIRGGRPELFEQTTMDVVETVAEVRELVGQARAAGRSIGFVPTMGALHAGHRSLVQAARKACDYLVVSIFVNPAQFGPNEDYDRYPKTPEADLEACRVDGADLVFQPAVGEMYPGPRLTTVHVAGLTEGLCGASRPGHFDGVTTVVAKLFNIVTPDLAYFGDKDYQQLQVIRRMVRDLDLPVEIVAGPTVREPDGLAMSSRNQYLTDAERKQATVLYRSRCEAADAVSAGRTDAQALAAGIEEELKQSGPVTIDYVRIVDPESLEELGQVSGPARICLAVRIGQCRLIDNLAVEGTPPGR